MERSRIVVVVAALLGIVGTFLPWLGVAGGGFAMAGIDGIDGSVNLALFAVPLLLAALGRRHALLSSVSTLVVCAFGLLGAGFAMLHVLDHPPGLEAKWGLTLIVAAGCVVALHPLARKAAADPVVAKQPAS